MICKRIIVRGHVQGVFFRASTKEQADALGLTGEVRNLADGSVEIIACGTEAQLQQLVQWCHAGPPRARVSSVDTTPVEPTVFDDFKIVRC